MRPREYKLDLYTYIVDHMLAWIIIGIGLCMFILSASSWVRFFSVVGILGIVLLLCLEYRAWEKHYK